MSRFSFARYVAIVKKEIIQIKRDKPSLAIAVMMPIMLLFLFGYAVNTDVDNLKTVVWDQSNSQASRQIVQKLANTQIFRITEYVYSYEEIERFINNGQAGVGIIIPPDFANKRDNQENTKIQVLIDGSDPNNARTAANNSLLIIQNEAISLQETYLEKQGVGKIETPIMAETRVLFNPNMKSIVFNVPALIGLIMQNVTMILTAFSLVREKERGTMEQLIVTPIRPAELILGKITPYVLIGLFSFSIVLLIGTSWFGVPVKGSIPLLFVLSILFLVTTLTLGIFVSTVSKTQLQAMQIAFALILPSVLLSGFMFPRETMPLVIQWLGGIIPLTYFLEILRGIFLKGVDLTSLWQETLGMTTIFLVICTVVILKFRKKIE